MSLLLKLLTVQLLLLRNIGVIFNNSLSMLPHVTAVCKSSFFHLRNFKIRKFLSYDARKILIHSFITSKNDYCNSLLYGQPKCIYNVCRVSLMVLQGSFISAVDVNISLLCLFSFIWLPIERRITFKIAVITFKALHVDPYGLQTNCCF